MARESFGTDGVRGIVGRSLTPELVERVVRAAVLWSGAREVFVGRDTRGSGIELEDAAVRGVVSAGAAARLGGVVPTPPLSPAAPERGGGLPPPPNPPQHNA